MTEPTVDDVTAVEMQYGPLPEDADLAMRGDRYRLYQAQALIREALGAEKRRVGPLPEQNHD